MGHEDLPPVQHAGERDGAVPAPVVEDGQVVDEDDEVVDSAFVEDLGGGGVGARHYGWIAESWVGWLRKSKYSSRV
jgi:hypothetical protein